METGSTRTGSMMAERWLAERRWTDRTTFERGDRDLREELDAATEAERVPVYYADDHDVEAFRESALAEWVERETAEMALEVLVLRRISEGAVPERLEKHYPRSGAETAVAYETTAWAFRDGSMVVDVAEAGGWDVVAPDRRGGRGCVLDMRTHDEILDEHGAVVGVMART